MHTLDVETQAQHCRSCNRARYTDRFGVYGPWKMAYLIDPEILFFAAYVPCGVCVRVKRALKASKRLLKTGRQNTPEIVP